GHPLRRPHADVASGGCDDGLSAARPDRAHHPLRLLSPGPLDGGDRLRDGAAGRAPRHRVRRLRRAAAAHLHDLPDLGGARLYRDAAGWFHRLARACRALPPIRQTRRLVPAHVLRATRGGSLGSGGVIAAVSPMTDLIPARPSLVTAAQVAVVGI